MLLSLELGIVELEVTESVGGHGVDLLLGHVLVKVLVERFLVWFERKGLLLGLVVGLEWLIHVLGFVVIDFNHPVDEFVKDLLIFKQVVKGKLLDPYLLVNGVVRLDMFE